MIDSNIVKLVSDSGLMYVFDALTNNIYQVDDSEYFKSICSVDLGHNSDIRPNSLKISNTDKSVLSEAKTLILEITENCNLNCTYCVFNEKNISERNHSNKIMSIDIAIQSINDFYSRTNKNECYLIFYGGEPLLSFNLIREIVDYANKLSNFMIKYSLTTNGLLLTQDKLDFFIKNNFLITVSIDGNKEIHDKQRITNSQNGTFDIISNNIDNLKKYNNAYFTENILINCVITNINDIDDINNYFSKSDFKLNSIRITAVSENEILINKYILDRIMNDSNNFSKLQIVEYSYLNDILKKIEFRKLDSEAYMGRKLCIPFSNRTYIRTNGDVQFCEGIDNYKRISANTFNPYLLSEIVITEFNSFIEKNCSKCFAYNFCEMCPASFIRNSIFNKELAEQKCLLFRDTIQKALLIYINKMEIK